MTLASGNRISGGKALQDRAAKRVNRAGQALRLAASTVRHLKRQARRFNLALIDAEQAA